jgi:ankyrin repeat protein
MIISMSIIVAIALFNYAFKLLPTGVEKRRLDTIESRKAVLAAVAKGDVVNLHRLLAMNVEINFVHEGTAPILIAAENGYADIMQILVHQGAKVRVQNAEGKMPMEIALAKGFTRTAEIIHYASEADLAQATQAVAEEKSA